MSQDIIKCTCDVLVQTEVIKEQEIQIGDDFEDEKDISDSDRSVVRMLTFR